VQVYSDSCLRGPLLICRLKGNKTPQAPTAPDAADSKDGLAAVHRGDSATALKLLSPLAQNGHARAQFNLGAMYDQGHGVAQDYKAAVKWYRLAADQGNAWAQVKLGLMYEQGQGVAQNYVYAHMWFNLAAASLSGDLLKDATSMRKLVSETMASAQIEQAQDMARKCQASNFKNCD
jgi:uncharacterized protein